MKIGCDGCKAFAVSMYILEAFVHGKLQSITHMPPIPPKKIPPSIQFEEEPSLAVIPKQLLITRILGVLSFGLIKTDAQSSVVALTLVLIGGLVTFYFVSALQTVEPTVYFEILPQESVGSSQGLPPVIPTHE